MPRNETNSRAASATHAPVRISEEHRAIYTTPYHTLRAINEARATEGIQE